MPDDKDLSFLDDLEYLDDTDKEIITKLANEDLDDLPGGATGEIAMLWAALDKPELTDKQDVDYLMSGGTLTREEDNEPEPDEADVEKGKRILESLPDDTA